jgi:hypothetical protein
MNISRDEDLRSGTDDHANRDPITHEPGSHPVGTGLGAAAAGAAGAIVGAGLGGPVGSIVGAALGASVGGGVGHYAAETANPTYLEVEPTLRDTFQTRSYASNGSYEDFAEAYSFGALHHNRLNTPWSEEVEAELRQRWPTHASSGAGAAMDWETARPAVRDAWEESLRVPGRRD